jgi:tetratricopeptide (TPR) repeat protein
MHYSAAGQTGDAASTEYKAAVADFSKAISLRPGNPNFYTWRADAKHMLYEHQGAIDDFSAALNAVRDPAVYIGRALEFEAYGVDLGGDKAKYASAIADLGRAIETAPKLKAGYFRRADTYRVMDDLANAERDSQSVLKLNPKDDAAMAELCSIARLRSRYDEAVEFCRRAIDLSPRYAAAYRERCEAYAELKQWPKAMADCDRAVEFDPNADDSWTARAEVYVGLKQYRRALDDYQRAVELNPSDAKRYADEIEQAKAKLGKGS